MVTTPTPGVVAHFDIAGPDVGRLHQFYAEVLGWKINDKGPGYALVGTPENSPNGAIVEDDDPAITIGVVVEDLEVALRSTEQFGGSVLMPPTDNGWVVKAQVGDPAGNRLTLIQG